MKHTILASALLAGLGLGLSTLPSAALPMNASGIAPSASSELVQVRMSRRQMRRHRRSGGNANMPSRRPGAKQYGQTTGGPRR